MERLPIGTGETLATINTDDFKAYYNGYYRPENTFVVLVGDIKTDYAITKIADYFADWTVNTAPSIHANAGTTPPRGADIGYFVDPEIQTSITLSTLKPYTDYTDTTARRKKSFIDGLGNRILNRRFSSLAQKSDAVFIGGGVGSSSAYETADTMSLTMSSRPENWQMALAVGEQELRKALKYGFTQAELDEQLANSKKSMQVSGQTADTRRTGSLASGILGAFAGEGVYTHPRTSLERFSVYENDITLEDVWGRFKEQWSALDTPMLYLQTSVILENPTADIKQAYMDSLTVEVEANAVLETSEFAYTNFGIAGKISSEKYIEDIDTHLIAFENNVLLNFKKTDFEKDTVRISVSVGDGNLSAPRKDFALMSLAGTVMGAGGA